MSFTGWAGPDETLVLFSAVMQPDQAAAVELRLAVNGLVVGDVRQLRVDVFSARVERLVTFEAFIPDLETGDVVAVQWRAVYGHVRISDRRLSLVG